MTAAGGTEGVSGGVGTRLRPRPPLWIRGLFQPLEPTPVANALVRSPVVIRARPVDLAALRSDHGRLAKYVDDLPVGTGFKGGMARKVVKALAGASPEPDATFDLDLLVLVGSVDGDGSEPLEVPPTESLRVREAVTGTRLGDLTVEAQDVEVHTKTELYEYFTTRDVTQNEALVLKRADGDVLLLATEACWHDCRAGRATPSVHALAGLAVIWDVDDKGRCFVAENLLCRAIVRLLKGHASQYGVDAETWSHFRELGLSAAGLFRVLRPFHDDDAKFNQAVDHLVGLGLLHRAVLRRVGGANDLWGHILLEMNRKCAHHGGRVTLNGLDPDAVEAWLSRKRAQAAQKLVSNRFRARRIGYVPADESAYSLGLVAVPQELHDYVASGAVFATVTGGAAPLPNRAATNPTAATSDVRRGQVPGTGRGAVGGGGDAPAGPAETAAAGAALAAGESTAVGGWVTTSQRVVLDSNALHAAACACASASARSPSTSAAAEQVADSAALRTPLLGSAPDRQSGVTGVGEHRLGRMAAAALRRSGGSTSRPGSGSSGRDSLEDGLTRAHEMAVSGDLLPPDGSTPGLYADRLHVGFFEATEGGDRHVCARCCWGSASASGDGHGGDGGRSESGVRPAAAAFGADAGDADSRDRVTRAELLAFILSAMWPFRALLLVSYSLRFAALGLRLAASRAEGSALNALQEEPGGQGFVTAVHSVAVVWGGSVVADLCGAVALNVFARRALQLLFTRLFRHLVRQRPDFFARITLGEVSSRCSGDSLTMKALVSTTLLDIVAGAVQALSALVLLMVQATPLFAGRPFTAALAPLALAAQVAASLGLGIRIAHPLNRAARASLGRMYGFLFDTFSQLETVRALGLGGRQTADYDRFVDHYWHQRLKLDVLLASEAFLTSAAGAALSVAFLAALGSAYASGAVTGMGTVYAVLRYLHAMQAGVKMASDACARAAASLGSVERLVQLHDAGVLAPDDNGEKGPSGKSAYVGRACAGGARDSPGGVSHGCGGLARLQATGGVRLVDCAFSYSHKADVVVVKGVSLEVVPGAAVAITGPSGCGKSTVLRIAALDLLPFKGCVEVQVTEPDHHDPVPRSPVTSVAVTAAAADNNTCLRFDSRWIAFSPLNHSACSLRDHLAICSEATLGIFFATVEMNVACAAGNRAVTAEEVREASAFVGLDAAVNERLRDGFYTLLGGPNGVDLDNSLLLRISLARALIRRPKLFIVDETDHYCSVVGLELMRRVMRRLTDLGCAVLFSTWREQLATDLVIRPPGASQLQLIHYL